MTTTRIPRWQLRDDAEQIGRMLARSGRSRQSCAMPDKELQAALVRGWQAEIARMGKEIDRFDWAESELDAAEPQTPSLWWCVAAIVAGFAFAGGCWAVSLLIQ